MSPCLMPPPQRKHHTGPWMGIIVSRLWLVRGQNAKDRDLILSSAYLPTLLLRSQWQMLEFNGKNIRLPSASVSSSIILGISPDE